MLQGEAKRELGSLKLVVGLVAAILALGLLVTIPAAQTRAAIKPKIKKMTTATSRRQWLKRAKRKLRQVVQVVLPGVIVAPLEEVGPGPTSPAEQSTVALESSAGERSALERQPQSTGVGATAPQVLLESPASSPAQLAPSPTSSVGVGATAAQPAKLGEPRWYPTWSSDPSQLTSYAGQTIGDPASEGYYLMTLPNIGLGPSSPDGLEIRLTAEAPKGRKFAANDGGWWPVFLKSYEAGQSATAWVGVAGIGGTTSGSWPIELLIKTRPEASGKLKGWHFGLIGKDPDRALWTTGR